jgi:hypothetical protein
VVPLEVVQVLPKDAAEDVGAFWVAVEEKLGDLGG